LTDDEILACIEAGLLMGRGIGHVDLHLLASTALAGSARLRTRDERLATVADGLDLEFSRIEAVVISFSCTCFRRCRGDGA
jgi:hypothetical protein